MRSSKAYPRGWLFEVRLEIVKADAQVPELTVGFKRIAVEWKGERSSWED